jgi:hypothetical protein
MAGEESARFEIHNITDLVSGSRIPPILGGIDPNSGEKGVSVEELLEQDPSLAYRTVGWLTEHYKIISVLKARTRNQTTNGMGGGTMEQTFIWYEQYPLLGCDNSLPPWPVVRLFLNIFGGKSGGVRGAG